MSITMVTGVKRLTVGKVATNMERGKSGRNSGLFVIRSIITNLQI